jgi:hypothetical protein
MARPARAGTIASHQIAPESTMADRRDRPPILRALVLLLALVGSALALAALSPASPGDATPAADGKTASAVGDGSPAATRP